MNDEDNATEPREAGLAAEPEDQDEAVFFQSGAAWLAGAVAMK